MLLLHINPKATTRLMARSTRNREHRYSSLCILTSSMEAGMSSVFATTHRRKFRTARFLATAVALLRHTERTQAKTGETANCFLPFHSLRQFTWCP